MRTFKEFGIKPASKSFIGDKIKIDRIVNREIVVLDYKVEDSKYNKGNGKCLYLQIEFNGDDDAAADLLKGEPGDPKGNDEPVDPMKAMMEDVKKDGSK